MLILMHALISFLMKMIKYKVETRVCLSFSQASIE